MVYKSFHGLTPEYLISKCANRCDVTDYSSNLNALIGKQLKYFYNRGDENRHNYLLNLVMAGT